MSAKSDHTEGGGWQSGKSQQDCHMYMLNNHLACDVIIRFQSSGSSGASAKDLNAHRYMLMCRSSVLESLLNASKAQDGWHVIIVSDVDRDTFMEVLRYIYYDGADLRGDNVLHVLYAANKYMLDGLVLQCSEYLGEEITEQCVCTILSHSILYNEEITTARCLQYISENVSKVLPSPDFINITVNGLERFFASDEILAANFDETSLFNACISWANNMQLLGDKRHIRDILGNFLFQIRFATLMPDELTKIIDRRPGLLSQKEQSTLLRYVTLPTDRKGAEVEKLGFSTKRRGAGANAAVFATPCRFAQTSDYFVYNGADTCEIGFQVDNAIEFVGVTLYGGFAKNDEHSVHLSLYTRSGMKQLANAEATIVSQGTADPLQVTLPTSIPLVKHTVYTIKILMTGPHSYKGSLGVKDVTAEGIHFSFHDVGGSTCVEKGQIPQILFKMY